METTKQFKLTYLLFTNENRYKSKEKESGIYETADAAEKSVQEETNCYGYILYQREIICIDGKRFYSDWEECRKVMFGKKYSPEQIADMYPDDARFIKLANIFGGMVRTPLNTWATYDKNFELIERS